MPFAYLNRFRLVIAILTALACFPASAAGYSLLTTRGEFPVTGRAPITNPVALEALGSRDAEFLCFVRSRLFIRAGNNFIAVNGLARGMARTSAIRSGVWMREIIRPEAGTDLFTLMGELIGPGLDAANCNL